MFTAPLFSTDRDGTRAIADRWPISSDERAESTAIEESLRFLDTGPIPSGQAWGAWIPVEHETLHQLRHAVAACSGTADQHRARLTKLLALVEKLSDDQLSSHVRSLVAICSQARRLGLPVNPRLTALLPDAD